MKQICEKWAYFKLYNYKFKCLFDPNPDLLQYSPPPDWLL